MKGASESEAREIILRVVEGFLATRGYNGFQLREVAKEARVSLSRIYELFGTREELIVAAMERWMSHNGYADLTPPLAKQGIYEGLLYILRSLFEPWEYNPRMLDAFHRARRGRGGDRLVVQGAAAIRPALQSVLKEADPQHAADVELLLGNLFYAVFGRFSDGELNITDILPTLERAAFRLTADNTSAAKSGRRAATRPRKH